MKRVALIGTVLILGWVSGPALADQGWGQDNTRRMDRQGQDAHYESARVTSVRPVYEDVSRPEKRCWNETEYRSETTGSEYGGTVLGGLAGGILGNQVGGGNGKTVATAVGAVAGALVGKNLSAPAETRQTPVQVQKCATEDRVERRATGYTVGYRYGNREYTTFMLNQPGDTVRVRVNVEVDERN